ncbi:hypothetical protein VTP01DRAFT_4404 [Rhizomucor pusillus]|uniref:uncharacterized protein n=1 Tax=Rhizomucor pusillus TaxID=4840 RepID=UPI0037420140
MATLPTDYKHPDVCVDYLCGLCPYDILSRDSQWDKCPKLHLPQLKTQYEESVRFFPSRSLGQQHLRNLKDFSARRQESTQRFKKYSCKYDTDSAKRIRDVASRENVKLLQRLAECESMCKDGDTRAYLLEYKLREVARSIDESIRAQAGGYEENKGPSFPICNVCGVSVPKDPKPLVHEMSQTHRAFMRIREEIKDLESKERAYQ